MDVLYLQETRRLAERTPTAASAEHHDELGADKVEARHMNEHYDARALRDDELCSITKILDKPSLDNFDPAAHRLNLSRISIRKLSPYARWLSDEDWLRDEIWLSDEDSKPGIDDEEDWLFTDTQRDPVEDPHRQFLSALSTELRKQFGPKLIFQRAQEQLDAEVKGIYAGFGMIDKKCIEGDNSQPSRPDVAGQLNDEPWRPLTAPSSSPTGDPSTTRDYLMVSRSRPAWTRTREPDYTLKMPDSSAWTSWQEKQKELKQARDKTKRRWSEASARLDLLTAMTKTRTLIDHLAPTPTSKPSHPPVPLRSLPARILRTIFRLAIPLTITLLPALASATPSPGGVPYPTPKILLVGASALASLGTGMTALQLEVGGGTGDGGPSDARATQLLRLALRVVCSASLGTLAVAYVLCFLRWYARRKRAAFLAGFWVCSLACWLFVRGSMGSSSGGGGMVRGGSSSGGLSGSAGTAARGGGGSNEATDAFLWLDTFNLLGLLAVLAGILNAESSLFSSLFTHQGPTRTGGGVHGDDDGGDGDDGDDLGQDDEENQVAMRPRGIVNMNNGHTATDGMGNMRLGSVLSSLFSSVLRS